MRLRKVFAIGAIALISASAAASPAFGAPKNGGGGSTSASGTCNPRKSVCPTPDTTPPTVQITSPTGGTVVSGSVTVAGAASDNTTLAKVEVAIDGGPWTVVAGTSSWTYGVDTTQHANGDHTIAARATDGASNVALSTLTIRVDNAAAAPPPPAEEPAPPADPEGDIRLRDAESDQLEPLTVGDLPAWGEITAVVYGEMFSPRRAAYFRNHSTGASSYVNLPSDSTDGWRFVSAVMTSPTDLWTFGGNGPLVLRHYRLDAPLPTSATLQETWAFGDSDSRRAELLHLASGGLIAFWGQQGSTGAQGMFWAYRSPATGTWSHGEPLQFMPTKASKRVAIQHPADGSVWLFNNPDAFGRIGAVHFSETATGLRVDWTDPFFIQPSEHGGHAPDPENPDLAVAVDTAAGDIVLAYQSATRKVFSSSPSVIGSYPTIARISATGDMSFTHLPVYVERISSLGLTVRPGEVTLAYRAIDEATLSFDRLALRSHRDGQWQPVDALGQLRSAYEMLAYDDSRIGVATRMSDGGTHFFHR